MTGGKPRPFYRARYQRDNASKVWHVMIKEVPKIHAVGRTLDKAEENALLALSAALDVPSTSLALRHEYDVGGSAQEAVMAAYISRQRATDASNEATRLTRDAANKLTHELGLVLRDTARILQLSHQRVSQIVTEDMIRTIGPETRSRLDGNLRLPPR